MYFDSLSAAMTMGGHGVMSGQPTPLLLILGVVF